MLGPELVAVLGDWYSYSVLTQYSTSTEQMLGEASDMHVGWRDICVLPTSSTFRRGHAVQSRPRDLRPASQPEERREEEDGKWAMGSGQRAAVGNGLGKWGKWLSG